MFNNPPTSDKEYLYLRVGETYRSCAKIELDNAGSDVKMGTLYKDFIIHNKTTVYKLANPKDHMRMDFNIHQFSPSDVLNGSLRIQVVGTKNSKV